MFNFKRTEAAELHPMELALLGTGDVTLNAVAAELKMLADAGYIVFDGELCRKGSELPADYPAYDHVLVNSLFYKTEEISMDTVPMIVAYGVKACAISALRPQKSPKNSSTRFTNTLRRLLTPIT